jgi:hypothetical protein
MRRLAIAPVVSILLLASLLSPAGARAQTFRTVDVGAHRYYTADALAIASRIPGTSASFKLVMGVIRRCQGVRAHAFLPRSGGLAVGLVAWLPASPSACLEVSGGGPDPGSPCLQTFRTPRNQDPAGLTNRPSGPRWFVLIAATTAQVCADMATQVPGGVWGQTTVAAGGAARGAVMLIKCQQQTAQGLTDYLAPYRDTVPATKPAYWYYDAFVNTGGLSTLSGVPRCSGVNLRLG